jgi:hypothetical protein
LISNGVGAVPTWAASLTLGGNLRIGGTLGVTGVTTLGNLTIGGTLGVTGSTTLSSLTISGGAAIGGYTSITQATGVAVLAVRGTSPAAASGAMLVVANDSDPNLFYIQSFSSGFATDPQQIANGTLIFSNGVGGLTLSCVQTAAPMKFHTRGIERMRIVQTGEIAIGSAGGVYYGAKVNIATDGSVGAMIAVVNSNAGNTGAFLQCLNSVAVGAGGITQTGASTVSFNTSSDARLKDDAGRARDVSALRAVVVHDFTWKADGIRDRGVFAQEAHAHFPRAVSAGTDETTEHGDLVMPWATDYSKFVPDLIVGWQQHDEAIASLRATLNALQGMQR